MLFPKMQKDTDSNGRLVKEMLKNLQSRMSNSIG